jgi:hypothetical protein
MPNRFYQVLLIVSTAGFSWLAMQAVHEAGHVLHLGLTGGSVDYVILHPLAISYTHPAANPHPLAVASGGALWGCVLPLGFHLLARLGGTGCLSARGRAGRTCAPAFPQASSARGSQPSALLLPKQWHTARPCHYMSAFFAGFCLIANGAYLAGDAIVRGGDGRDLIALGCPAWLLVLVGVPLIGLGLMLWHGLGPHFGLGPAQGRVDRRAAAAMTLALVALVAVELLLSSAGSG